MLSRIVIVMGRGVCGFPLHCPHALMLTMWNICSYFLLAICVSSLEKCLVYNHLFSHVFSYLVFEIILEDRVISVLLLGK